MQERSQAFWQKLLQRSNLVDEDIVVHLYWRDWVAWGQHWREYLQASRRWNSWHWLFPWLVRPWPPTEPPYQELASEGYAPLSTRMVWLDDHTLGNLGVLSWKVGPERWPDITRVVITDLHGQELFFSGLNAVNLVPQSEVKFEPGALRVEWEG